MLYIGFERINFEFPFPEVEYLHCQKREYEQHFPVSSSSGILYGAPEILKMTVPSLTI